MKLVLTSLSLALASSALAAASPIAAAPPPAAAPTSDSAPSAERIELARRFVAVSQPGDDIVEGMRAAFSDSAAEEPESEALRAAAKERLDRLFARFDPKVREHQPAIVEAYVQAYAREFSADELRHMTEFASTPAGRHFLSSSAAVDLDDDVMGAQMELLEDVTPLMEDLRKELCAERAAQRIAAGDTKAKCPLSDPDQASG